MKKKETDKKHDLKRKRINISIYEKDEIQMKKKYGKLLSSTEIKNIVLEGEIVFKEKKDNTSINLLIVELKRIGNNINQLAHRANESNRNILEIELKYQLNVLKNVVSDIKNKI